jgi:hypothetical protein
MLSYICYRWYRSTHLINNISDIYHKMDVRFKVASHNAAKDISCKIISSMPRMRISIYCWPACIPFDFSTFWVQGSLIRLRYFTPLETEAEWCEIPSGTPKVAAGVMTCLS